MSAIWIDPAEHPDFAEFEDEPGWVVIRCDLLQVRANPPENGLLSLPSIEARVQEALSVVGIDYRPGQRLRIQPGTPTRLPRAAAEARSQYLDVGFYNRRSNTLGFTAHHKATGEVRLRFNQYGWKNQTVANRLNVVLHETAHAIQFILDNKASHDSQWLAYAHAIGCHNCSRYASEDLLAAHHGNRAPPSRRGARRTAEKPSLSRSDFALGETVAFEHKGERYVSKIVKMNAKTAGLANRWRVGYALLQKV